MIDMSRKSVKISMAVISAAGAGLTIASGLPVGRESG